MGSSSAFPCEHIPVRSISLPSRIHPTPDKVEAALDHLKTWQTLPSCMTSPLGAESIQVGLIGLAELYNCLGELIQSPQAQQAIVNHNKGQHVEEALDRSATFLDVCGAARDILVLMKEHLQTLQSALRRRGGDSRIESDISTYMSLRKKARKEISRNLGELKSLQNRICKSPVSDMEPPLQIVVRVLQESSAITISILQSFFLFLSMPSLKTKAAGWLKVSKLISSRLLYSDKGRKIVSELGSVDIAVSSLQGRAGNNDAKSQVQTTHKMIEGLNCTMDGLETGLECLFRSLIRNRVALLDILIH